MATPQSIIKICAGVRLDNTYQHTIYFEDTGKQLEYFAGKVVKTFSAYTHLRKQWTIKVDANMFEARHWNYLYFQNPVDGSNRHWYYFITNIDYINENTVELHLELDVMQTYMGEYTLLPSFVEREHVADDDIGLHLVDEGLDMGELTIYDSQDVNMGENVILVMSTFDPLYTTAESTKNVVATTHDGVYSGLGVYGVELGQAHAWGTKLETINEKLDGIVTMWMYPKSLVKLEKDITWDSDITHEIQGVEEFTHSTSRPASLKGGYTPRNKKLYCYPYNFCYVHNNSGSAGVFKYERFGDPSDIRFNINGALSPEGVVKCYPLNYDNQQHNWECGLTLAGYPSCAWNQDLYKLWLAQNQNSQNLSTGMSALSIAGGLGAAVVGGVTGNVPVVLGGLASMAGGASQIASTMAQKADREIQPPQARGQTSSSLNVANNFQTFTVERKCITEEYAHILDEYFDVYGYRVNRVKVPNRYVRKNWTYTKTIGCKIASDLCTEDAVKIQSIYDKGVTFWKDGDSIGNYTLSNKQLYGSAD